MPVNGFLVDDAVQKYNYESLENYEDNVEDTEAESLPEEIQVQEETSTLDLDTSIEGLEAEAFEDIDAQEDEDFEDFDLDTNLEELKVEELDKPEISIQEDIEAFELNTDTEEDIQEELEFLNLDNEPAVIEIEEFQENIEEKEDDNDNKYFYDLF